MKRPSAIIVRVLFLVYALAITSSCTPSQKRIKEVNESDRLEGFEEMADKGRDAYKDKNYEEALSYFKRAKEILEREEIVNKDYSFVLNRIADCYYFLGNYSEAIKVGNQDLEVTKGLWGEKSDEYASSLADLANSYSYFGNNNEAIELSLQSLEIKKEIFGEQHLEYTKTLIELAGYFLMNLDYLESQEFCIQALHQNMDSLYKVPSNYLSWAFDYFAMSNLRLGEYSVAFMSQNLALDVAKVAFGESDPQYAQALGDMALCYEEIGDYSKAFEFNSQALEIIRKSLGENHLYYARFLNNMASNYALLGDYLKAIELCSQALKLRRKILGKNNPIYAESLSNLARYYALHGDNNKAIELHSKALKTLKEMYREHHPDYAHSLHNLAFCYANIGNYTKSIKLYNQVLEIDKENSGEQHPFFSVTLSSLASCYFHLGDYSTAVDSLQKVVKILQTNILNQFNGFRSNQRIFYWSKYMSEFTSRYPLYVYKSSSRPTGDLYDKSALFAKGLLLTTEIEMNKLIQESGDEEALSMFEELRQKRLVLQKLYDKSIVERDLNTDSLEQEADKLESELVKRSQVYGDFSRKLRTTWKDVQAALDEDEMAVEFLSFGVGTDSTMVVALTLRKDDKEPKMIPLFEQKQMEKVRDVKISRDRSVRKTKTFYSQEVTDLVWKPMAEELKGIKRIYFSAAGILHKVGIEYAPGMEDYDIYRLSTTREVIDMKEKGEKNLNAKSDAVLYGGVDYEALAKSKAQKAEARKGQKDEDDITSSISIDLHQAFIDSLKVRGTDLKYLPGTLDEVKHISSCFDQKHRRAITGTDATETSVKSLPDKLPKILHIATHGFYYTEKEKARMDVRKGMLLDDERGHAGRQEDEALNRSGLFMAGANRTLKGEELPMEADDGILTAQEIAKIDLRGVDMVVLSACETGQGDINQGEGVYGLQRGFKKAGVQTILMSLWKVSDKATEILMTEFYKQVCAGKNKHESLRMAQKKVREYKNSEGKLLFEDPFFWAGFILLD